MIARAGAPQDGRLLPRPTLIASSLWVACVGVSVLAPVACPFRAASGFDCPACGATRALESVAHIQPLHALDHNAGAVLLGVIIAAYLLLAAVRWRVPPWLHSSVAGRHRLAILVAVVVGWGVLRNLPGLAWFSSPLAG